MVRRAFVQRSLVEVLLPDSDKLWDPALRAIDEVLTDDGLVDQVVEALGGATVRAGVGAASGRRQRSSSGCWS